MPRLFTGIEVPSDIAFDLSLMKGGIPGARWVDSESLHMTLRFVGDVSDTVADDIDSALSDLQFDPFELQLTGAGFFGGTKPRALYIDVAANPALQQLQLAHERACQISGLPPEGRKYTPHVTVARLRSQPIDIITDFIARHALYSSRKFKVARTVLFSARPGRGGGPYVPERIYQLEDVPADLPEDTI